MYFLNSVLTINCLTRIYGRSSDTLNKKLLVVDDEKDTIFLVRSILEPEGFEVFGAGGGAECLKMLGSVKPDASWSRDQAGFWTAPNLLTRSRISSMQVSVRTFIIRPADKEFCINRRELTLLTHNQLILNEQYTYFNSF